MSTKDEIWDLNDWDSMIWAGTSNDDLKREIKSPKSSVFRRAFIKRRQLSDGLFESTWKEISVDVKSYGSIKQSIDVQRQGKLQFSGATIKMSNIEGRYNPDDNANSLWSGFGDQQRTLFKIEAGFQQRFQDNDNIWRVIELPSTTTVFIGIISGNIFTSSKNEVSLPIKPLTQVFRDFPATELNPDVFTTTGMTASKFMEGLRDFTNGGSFVFRPFFQDTVTNWEITATTNDYTNLNTSSADDLQDKDIWDVVEKLSEAENFATYITPTGKLRFVSKTETSANQFEFHGLGQPGNTEFGHTIKKVFTYGKHLTKFYSRTAVKFKDTISAEGFAATGLAFAINGTNTAWNLGHRTFRITNLWIPDTATANTVAQGVFADISSQKELLNFSTSFISHLNILDKVEVSYDASDVTSQNSVWDQRNWSSFLGSDVDPLFWDADRGDAIVLDGVSFKVLSININLDKFETRFVCKQL